MWSLTISITWALFRNANTLPDLVNPKPWLCVVSPLRHCDAHSSLGTAGFLLNWAPEYIRIPGGASSKLHHKLMFQMYLLLQWCQSIIGWKKVKSAWGWGRRKKILLRWIFYCTLMINSSDKTSLCVYRAWGLPAFHFSFISLVTQHEEDNLNLWCWLSDEGGKDPFRRVTYGALRVWPAD